MKAINIELESGVPIPPRSYSRSTRPKSHITYRYPWAEMDVLDSFFVPLPEGRSMRQHQVNLQVAAKMSVRSNGRGRKYVTRIAQKHGQKGVRVWRIR